MVKEPGEEVRSEQLGGGSLKSSPLEIDETLTLEEVEAQRPVKPLPIMNIEASLAVELEK